MMECLSWHIESNKTVCWVVFNLSEIRKILWLMRQAVYILMTSPFCLQNGITVKEGREHKIPAW